MGFFVINYFFFTRRIASFCRISCESVTYFKFSRVISNFGFISFIFGKRNFGFLLFTIIKTYLFEKRQRIVDYSQVRVPDRVFGMECFVVSFLSFSLFFLFLNPTMLILFCNTVVMNLFF